MSKELKTYRLTNLIMQYSKGTVRYEDALSSAKQYYEKKPFIIGLFSHVGTDYVAREICSKLKGGVKKGI